MKKQIIFTVCVLFALFTVNAQEKGNIEIGGGFGLNISAVSTLSSNESTPSLTSYNLGLSGEYYFSDRWGLKVKMIYDKKGWAEGFFVDENNSKYTTDYKLNYITLPVMANWHFSSQRSWYLNFGAYVGFLLDASETTKGRVLTEAFNKNDFGLALGIGYKFTISDNVKMFIEYDSQSGYSDVFKQSNQLLRNGRSSFNLGVLYSL